MSGAPMWQNRRNPAAVSHDGGHTYYLVHDDRADGASPTFTSAVHVILDRALAARGQQ